MATKYGKTIWGQQWLNSLANIDYDNRLPRGRTYANKGYVKEISINKNKIAAKVAGSRRMPYSITIEIPAFTKLQQEVLMQAILAKPTILSKLMNLTLPAEFIEITKSQHIPLFPQSWSDLKMHCSCPDWAVPCKHIASVIYLLANEIDRNPFLLFELHNFDIPAELAQRGYLPEKNETPVPQISALLHTQSQQATNEQATAIHDIDFSSISPMQEDLLNLLGNDTLFYNKDFKPQLKRAYQKTGTSLASWLNSTREKEHTAQAELYTKASIIVDKHLLLRRVELYFPHQLAPAQTIYRAADLIDFLIHIPDSRLAQLSPCINYLLQILKFAIKLTEQSAYIPQLLATDEKKYLIRWIPALMNESVKKVFETLTPLASTCELQVLNGETTHYLTAEEQNKTLCNILISSTIKWYSHHYVKESTVDSLFFKAAICKFEKLGAQQIPLSIHQWLTPLFIHNKHLTPIIQITIEEDIFVIDLLVEVKQDHFTQPVTLKSFLTNTENKNDQLHVLKDLSLLTTVFPELGYIIDSQGADLLEFEADIFSEIFTKILPLIRLYGIRVLLPKELEEVVHPKPTLQLSTSGEGSVKSFLSLEKMLEFNWQISLGDKHMNPDEFFRMVRSFSGLVKIKDQYVYLDKTDLAKLEKQLSKNTRISSKELIKAALTEEYKQTKIHLTQEVRDLLQSMLSTPEIPIPANLQATLRPYQERGYQWLFKNLQLGMGCIIADDMGLGKTLQVISLLAKLKEDGHLQKQKALVVVPTTLLTNWQKEIAKFTPHLIADIYHGPQRTLNIKDGDIILTSYGIARSDQDELNQHKWKCLIIDEAQNIKNPSSKQTQAIKKIKAQVRIAMSGTPVENRLSEYWSIFDFIQSKYLGSLKQFIKEIAIPIEIERNQHALEHFKTLTSPFILRRIKTDKNIISDLPEKQETNQYVTLTKEQASLYQNVINKLLPAIAQEDKEKNPANIKRQGMVFKLMTALKQICNHPAHYLQQDTVSTALSGKTQMLMALLEKIYDRGEKVLIFTQYKEMGKILTKLIEDRFKYPTLFLHGSISRKNRDTMVHDFQELPQYKTFIISIKAGGTGLNLTQANHVIHFDLWWNPAVEQQATDRAFRIGQKKDVMVYRLITQNTFEEKIDKMIQDKKELANLTVGQGEKWLGNLSTEQIKELVQF